MISQIFQKNGYDISSIFYRETPNVVLHNTVMVDISGNTNNRAYQEDTNFENFVPRNLKFHTFSVLHTTKKC